MRMEASAQTGPRPKRRACHKAASHLLALEVDLPETEKQREAHAPQPDAAFQLPLADWALARILGHVDLKFPEC